MTRDEKRKHICLVDAPIRVAFFGNRNFRLAVQKYLQDLLLLPITIILNHGRSYRFDRSYYRHDRANITFERRELHSREDDIRADQAVLDCIEALFGPMKSQVITDTQG